MGPLGIWGCGCCLLVLRAQVGSCGYGVLSENQFPFAYFASVISNDNLDLYSGKCGVCYELDCTGSPSQWWDSSVCTGSNAVVQVTGQCTCPAGQPDRPCCKSQPYMVVSKKAMKALADPVWDGARGIYTPPLKLLYSGIYTLVCPKFLRRRRGHLVCCVLYGGFA